MGWLFSLLVINCALIMTPVLGVDTTAGQSFAVQGGEEMSLLCCGSGSCPLQLMQCLSPQQGRFS